MEFGGLTKMTVLDYPNKIACTLFTKGCNLRCPFCHNSELVIENKECINIEEIKYFLRKNKPFLDGVCITGGEPLIQNGLVEFFTYVKSLGYLIKLDTNGYLPSKLKLLIDLDLIDYIAMDIKSDKRGYDESVGKHVKFGTFRESVDIIKNSGIEHEFRTTLVKEFVDINVLDNITKIIGKDENYYLQTFRDEGTNICSGLHGYTEEEENIFLRHLRTKMNKVEIRGI